MKDFIKTILKRIHHYWVTRNNDAFCNYLRNKGVNVQERVKFRYPEHAVIDLTRPSLIEIGCDVDINDNFSIMTHDFGTFVFRNLYSDFIPSSGRVKIGNNVYFGRDVTILKGVTIGDNCIIGLGSVVTKDIPSNSVVCGSPARVVFTLEEYYEKRKKQSVKEAILYARHLREKIGRDLLPDDFSEEWALFFREEDFKEYPEMHKIIDWRLSGCKKLFWEKHKPMFDGFNDFMRNVYK